ncbi:MAG: MlaD family protein [Planctomycetota bacterium]|jgi:ABC-type transporter Mla subunit MlaD
MATHQEKVTAGLFLLIGIGLILGVLFLIVGIQVTRGTDTYYVIFEGSIGNLKEGSPVNFMGVPVGDVSDLRLAPDLASIEAELDLVKGTRITSGTSAQLKFSPLTNVYYIELFMSKGELGEDLQPGAVIAHTKTEVDEFVSQLPVLQGQLQHLLNQTVDILSDENLARFDLVLEGVSDFITRVNVDYHGLHDELLMAVKDLRSSMKTFDETLAALRQEVEGFRHDAREGLDRAAGALEGGAGDLSTFLDELKLREEIATTRDAVIRLLEQYEKAAEQTEGMVAENRKTMRNLLEGLESLTRQMRTLVRKLEEDPSRLMWSKPTPERETPE